MHGAVVKGASGVCESEGGCVGVRACSKVDTADPFVQCSDPFDQFPEVSASTFLTRLLYSRDHASLT